MVAYRVAEDSSGRLARHQPGGPRRRLPLASELQSPDKVGQPNGIVNTPAARILSVTGRNIPLG